MFACVAAGCATAGRARYDTLAASYRELEMPAMPARSHDDGELARGKLERAALVRAVLQRNPSVESAKQAFRAALARYRQAGAYDDPMAMVQIAPLSVASHDARFGYELGLRQAISLGGKRDARAQLALAEAEVQSADLRATRLRLGLTASQLYDDYCVATWSLTVAAEHAKIVSAVEANVVAGYASGRGGTRDALRAEAELARLQQQTVGLEADRDMLVAELNALLHRAPDAPLAPPPSAAELHAKDLPTASDSAATGPARRPDLEAADARVRAERARVALADDDFVPDLTLEASYNSMWDMPEHRFMAGVVMSIPLERERRKAALDEASATRAMSESDAARMHDEAASQIAVARRQVERAHQVIALLEERLLPIAQRRIEATRAGLSTEQNGVGDVLEAEHALRDVELELQAARADHEKRRAELDAALGTIPGLTGAEAVP